MSKFLTVLLILYIAFSTCKKKPGNLGIQDNPEIPDEVQILQVSKVVFGDEFREVKIEKLPGGNHVFIEYGGKSALSFRNPSTYEMETRVITAYYCWKFIHS